MTHARLNFALINAPSAAYSRQLVINASLVLKTSVYLLLATMQQVMCTSNSSQQFEAFYSANNVSNHSNQNGTWIKVRHSDEHPFDKLSLNLKDCDMIVGTSPNNTIYQNISNLIQCLWGNQQGPTTEFSLEQNNNASRALLSCFEGIVNVICASFNRINHPVPEPSPTTLMLQAMWPPLVVLAAICLMSCMADQIRKRCNKTKKERMPLIPRNSTKPYEHVNEDSGVAAAIEEVGLPGDLTSSKETKKEAYLEEESSLLSSRRM